MPHTFQHSGSPITTNPITTTPSLLHPGPSSSNTITTVSVTASTTSPTQHQQSPHQQSPQYLHAGQAMGFAATHGVASGATSLVSHNNNTSGSSSNSSHKLLHHDSNSSDGDLLSSSKDHLLSAQKSSSKKRRRFSPDEDQKILTGVSKFFDEKKKVVDWDRLVKWSDLDRTKEQIKNRYGRIKPKGSHIPAPPSTSSTDSHAADPSSPLHAVEYEVMNHVSEFNTEEPVTKRQKTIHDYVPIAPKIQTQPPTPKTPTSLPSTTSMQDIFAKVKVEPSSSNSSNNNHSLPNNYSTNNSSNSNNTSNNQLDKYQQQKYEETIIQLRKQVEERDQKIISYDKKVREYEQKLQEMTQEHQTLDTTRVEKYCNGLIEILTKLAEQERKDDRDKMNENSIKIGTITYQKTIGDAFEVWQDGELFIDLERRQAIINAERERIEKMKKQLQKQRANIKKTTEQQQSATSPSTLMPAPSIPSTSSSSSISQTDILLNDLNEQEEIYKLRLNQIKKDEVALAAEREKLMIEKSIQVREIKRIRDQERSRFKSPTLIQKRYFLMKLLGRGGFSEVYKAYDLLDCKIVACKIHQINPSWKEHRKENYIKHVLRECQIHKSVKHPRLIQMFDTFILDNNTFVTVLEFCEGYDLDLYIKKHQKIPEKEAKSIIAQVFSGLSYMNQQKNKIIHFDLKPANILFTDGQIKITDFGLSKIMEEEDSIELTSQGAGTYWYLPPECFDVGKTPKISPKVDVWSAGVVFYQMLFGKKPFGNDLSQQKILSEQTIVNAKTILFPPKPVVSEECKEFIRKCLTYNPNDRPDVISLYNDKYLRSSKNK